MQRRWCAKGEIKNVQSFLCRHKAILTFPLHSMPRMWSIVFGLRMTGSCFIDELVLVPPKGNWNLKFFSFFLSVNRLRKLVREVCFYNNGHVLSICSTESNCLFEILKNLFFCLIFIKLFVLLHLKLILYKTDLKLLKLTVILILTLSLTILKLRRKFELSCLTLCSVYIWKVQSIVIFLGSTILSSIHMWHYFWRILEFCARKLWVDVLSLFYMFFTLQCWNQCVLFLQLNLNFFWQKM